MTPFFEWRDAPAARFAVIGDPISHSLSPQMQNAALRAMGEEGEYLAVRVESGEACAALDHLAGLGFRGVNVTVPNKAAVMPWLEELEPFATRVGAANTIDLPGRRGTNTDGDGFLDTLSELSLPDDAQVLILGAGGSARALVPALAEAGYNVVIWNRTLERAERLVRELDMLASVQAELDLAGFDLIVNATSSSLGSDQNLDLDWTQAEPSVIAYELSYGAVSNFLAGASARGLRTVDGKSLLVAQGARSLEWWLRRPAPREVMREAIK